MLDVVSTRNDEVANYPNVSLSPCCIPFHILTSYQPFQGINSGAFGESNVTWISLVDGSTAKENIPLGPLFVKSRGLDVIVAIDTSGDDENKWPKCVLPPPILTFRDPD
jgi:lysophospholipase